MKRPSTPVWFRLCFWVRAVVETLGARRFSRLLGARVPGRAVEASGLEHVEVRGGVVFAVNHYHARLTFDVIAATLHAAARVRAGVADACTVVVGQRLRGGTVGRLRRFGRACADWLFSRWGANAVRIPTDARLGVAALRTVHKRAAEGPVLVFPEGVAKGAFVDLRPGAGRFAAGLGVPVVPVGVVHEAGRWRVSFGAPIAWSVDRDLHDVQLGLAIAALLPAEAAPSWQPLLARWRAAHAEAA